MPPSPQKANRRPVAPSLQRTRLILLDVPGDRPLVYADLAELEVIGALLESGGDISPGNCFFPDSLKRFIEFRESVSTMGKTPEFLEGFAVMSYRELRSVLSPSLRTYMSFVSLGGSTDVSAIRLTRLRNQTDDDDPASRISLDKAILSLDFRELPQLRENPTPSPARDARIFLVENELLAPDELEPAPAPAIVPARPPQRYVPSPDPFDD